MIQKLDRGTAFHFSDLGVIAERVRARFQKGGVQIHPESELGRILKAATSVATEMAKPHDVTLASKVYFDAHSLARLAHTLAPLPPPLLPKRRLRSLYDGDLNFWSSVQSLAKDTEWECLVAGILSSGGLEVQFTEPPDIHVSGEGIGRSIGIACKKIYSLDNAGKQISKGLKQIKKSGLPGILALSLDHFAGKEKGVYSFLAKGDVAGAQALAGQIISDFVSRERINRTIEGAKLVGTMLYAQFFVEDRQRPSYFMPVSITRITHRGGSAEAKAIMDTVDKAFSTWIKRVLPDSDTKTTLVPG